MNSPTDDIGPLEQALGHTFGRPELLRQALTHASLTGSRADRRRSNERLEFLGDRVLGLVVARMLFAHFPDEEEGDLARRLAALVQRDSLARIASGIDLARYIAVSPGEAEAGGLDNPSLLADTCEAVIAALYLDGGLQAAADFIESHWQSLIDEDPRPPKDAKTALQEWAQGRGLALPVYREISRDGPAHAPRFHMEVSVEGLTPSSGSGSSKRIAEQVAAEALLSDIASHG